MSWDIDLKKSNKKKNIIHIAAYNQYGWAMRQPLRFDENKFDKTFEEENLLNTPDDSDIGWFLESNFLCPNIRKEKATNFSSFVLNVKLLLKVNLVIL